MDNGLHRLIYGFDSFGNICDKVNKKTNNISLNGADLTGHRYLLNKEMSPLKLNN